MATPPSQASSSNMISCGGHRCAARGGPHQGGLKVPAAAELAGPGLRAVLSGPGYPAGPAMAPASTNTRIVNLATTWPTPWGGSGSAAPGRGGP